MFDDIVASKVIIRSEKLYVNRKDGFVGTSLKKDEFVAECSDIDDVIIFRKNGKMMISKVSSKAFFGKDIIHIALFKKSDKRTVYNSIYLDGVTGVTYMKRFNVTSITREKEYDITTGTKGSKMLYFSANPNGEAEIVNVILRVQQKVKKLKFDIDFADLAVKGRGIKGNQVTKLPIRKIELKEKGVSTLAARKIWYDDSVKRLNVEERGRLLGEFLGDDKLMVITTRGTIKIIKPELNTHFDDDMFILEKWDEQLPISVIYFDGEKKKYYIKRFNFDRLDKEELFISEAPKSFLLRVALDYRPIVELEFAKTRGKEKLANREINIEEFTSIKGYKSIGRTLTEYKIKKVDIKEPLPYVPLEIEGDESGDEDDDNQVVLEL